jgi:hypothetical protein
MFSKTFCIFCTILTRKHPCYLSLSNVVEYSTTSIDKQQHLENLRAVDRLKRGFPEKEVICRQRVRTPDKAPGGGRNVNRYEKKASAS